MLSGIKAKINLSESDFAADITEYEMLRANLRSSDFIQS